MILSSPISFNQASKLQLSSSSGLNPASSERTFVPSAINEIAIAFLPKKKEKK